MTEHWRGWRLGKVDNHIAKHQHLHHGGDNQPKFVARAVRYHGSALQRQVGEAVRIRRRGGEAMILNSKSEYNRCKIPRLVVEQVDEVALQQEEETRKRDVEERIMSTQAAWERNKTASRTKERKQLAKTTKVEKERGKRRTYTLVEDTWGEEESSNINKKQRRGTVSSQDIRDPLAQPEMGEEKIPIPKERRRFTTLEQWLLPSKNARETPPTPTPSPPGEYLNKIQEGGTPPSTTAVAVCSTAGLGPAALVRDNCQEETDCGVDDDAFGGETQYADEEVGTRFDMIDKTLSGMEINRGAMIDECAGLEFSNKMITPEPTSARTKHQNVTKKTSTNLVTPADHEVPDKVEGGLRHQSSTDGAVPLGVPDSSIRRLPEGQTYADSDTVLHSDSQVSQCTYDNNNICIRHKRRGVSRIVVTKKACKVGGNKTVGGPVKKKKILCCPDMKKKTKPSISPVNNLLLNWLQTSPAMTNRTAANQSFRVEGVGRSNTIGYKKISPEKGPIGMLRGGTGVIRQQGA